MIIPTLEIATYLKYGCPHCGATVLKVITEKTASTTYIQHNSTIDSSETPGRLDHIEAFCGKCVLRVWTMHRLWDVYPAHLPHRSSFEDSLVDDLPFEPRLPVMDQPQRN